MSEGTSPASQSSVAFDEAVERVPFLRSLPVKVREQLRPVAEIRSLSEGETVFALGQASQEFTFLVRGHVKLVKPREDGREVILDIRGPGNLLCAGAVSAFAPYCCTALALDGDITTIAFPRREMHRLLEEHAPAGALFVQQASHNEMRLAGRVFELTSGHVEQRISALLLRLCDQVGSSLPDGSTRIAVRLSRQDLADLCGTTLESAIRTMTHLARENVVKTAGHGFVITDRPRLQALARGAHG